MEAISHAGTVLAVLSKEGIAIAAEKVGLTLSPYLQGPICLTNLITSITISLGQ